MPSLLIFLRQYGADGESTGIALDVKGYCEVYGVINVDSLLVKKVPEICNLKGLH